MTGVTPLDRVLVRPQTLEEKVKVKLLVLEFSKRSSISGGAFLPAEDVDRDCLVAFSSMRRESEDNGVIGIGFGT